MNVHDWALVIFTIAAQMAVGSFLILGGVHFFATRAAGEANADQLSDRALLAIGPVLVIGFIASLFHLGSPLNAPLALSHLGTSWLSREILFGVLFAVGGFLFAILQWRKIGTPTLRRVIAVVTAVFGIGLVFTMSMVYYSLPMVPAWSSLATPVTFFTTTFLLGALAMGAAFVANYAYLQRKDPEGAKRQVELLRTTLHWIALISIALLGVQFIVLPLYMAELAAGNSAAQASAAIIIENNGVWFFLRLLLVFLGAGVFSLFLYQAAVRAQRVSLLGTLAYTAFVLVLIGEVVGRYLFYASYVRVGI
jgi:anaerobic dimethyl sulfoxide reductase subunit C